MSIRRILQRSPIIILILVTALLANPALFATASEVAAYPVPDDVELVFSLPLTGYGLTYERYQQYFEGAKVFGAQLTLYRDDAGAVALAIGTHYANVTPTNQVGLSRAAAKGLVDREIGAAGERLVDLMINPTSGRYFYRVETRRADSRWIHWIDAGNGRVLNKYDSFATDCGTPPCGFGVAYDDGDATDIKDLTDLTMSNGSEYLLQSARQETHDQGSQRRPHLGPVATDADNLWVLPGDVSPAQPALVDSQYYAYVTDEYYMDTFGYDWVAAAIATTGGDVQKMVLHAHYLYQYDNAGWNGSYVVLGDGNQVEDRELTSLDIIAHELAHAVTDFTSDLVYQDEPGALNEAFSDIMAVNAEFYAETNGLEPAVTLAPDWLVGEDIDLRGDDVEPGFRNMADPEEDNDPDHYTERYIGSDDNGGVHSNSGIPNHAYYLLVEGGLNASCASPGDHNSAHCTDGDQDDNLSVTGIGLADAEQIFFLGFSGLDENASMCDARTATEGAAAYLYGSSSQESQSTTNAWVAVGLTDAVCGGGGNLPPTASFTFTCTDLTCDFDGSASYDSDGTLVSYEWDFGDDTTGSGLTPSHTYTADGNYTVTLTVTDDDAATDDDVQVVSVSSGGGNLPPIASFSFTCTDLTCDFDGSASYDSDGSIVSYEWDFGDDTTGSGVNPSHTYAADGDYTVTLTVTDDDAATDDDVQAVSVSSGGGEDTMHVADIDMWYSRAGSNYYVYTKFTVVDENNAPVSDATVSIEMTLPSGSTASGSSATGSDGTVTFSLKTKQTGTFISQVTNVTHATLTYAPGDNVETSESLAVP